MLSRVTDDDHMAKCDCVAISEPAFWAGLDRDSSDPATAGASLSGLREQGTSRLAWQSSVDTAKMA
jgi:hypothetical protein